MPYLKSASYELPFASGSDTSRDAAIRAERFVGAQGRAVYDWWLLQGEHGATQREASAAMGIERASICARVNELEKQERLTRTLDRRAGCVVYKVRV